MAKPQPTKPQTAKNTNTFETTNWVVFDMTEGKQKSLFVNSDEATDEASAIKFAREKWHIPDDEEREFVVETFMTNKRDRPAMRTKISPITRR